MKLFRILHAGYLMEHQGTKIAFDPLFENPFSKNCFAYPSVEFDKSAIQNLELDAVFISHYHDDHFSLDSLNLLDRKIPIYFFSVYDELFDLVRELGFQNVHPVALWKAISIGPFQILPLEALDADVDSIYHVQVGGLNILNVVDSWIGPKNLDLLSRTSWDLVLWPFQTMREIEVISPTNAEPATAETQKLPPEWIEQLQALKPQAIVPSSCQFQFENWSWYNQAFFPISYQSFAQQIQNVLPTAKVLRLDPGQSVVLSTKSIERSDPLKWISVLEPKTVDYQFDPDAKPQKICEIAKRFPALNPDQKKQVSEFCQKLTPNHPWTLKVYDHGGQPTEYRFQQPTDADWLTEIAETKLYTALTEGESLTSIYVRISQPRDADPLQDPLLSALYDGSVGAYQKAQLAALRKLC